MEQVGVGEASETPGEHREAHTLVPIVFSVERPAGQIRAQYGPRFESVSRSNLHSSRAGLADVTGAVAGKTWKRHLGF
jgi:hypothetical protein